MIMNKLQLSAVVLSQNEEKNLPRCLQSLKFADEIVVVDALSEDDSVKIAGQHGARVISREWSGFSKQWQFALNQARGDWIFMCAADEEVTAELAAELRNVINGDPAADGFQVQRHSQYLGDWMRHGPWASDFQLRLFRRGAGTVTGQAVHEGVQLNGQPGRLIHPLLHYTHQTLTESVARLNRYTTLESNDRADRRRISPFDFFISPLGVFFKYYISKGCWRAGVRGFLLSAVTAMYKSVLYIKTYFLQRTDPPEARS
jgi:glycosyltransferase involved in cell wall biosynthesis